MTEEKRPSVFVACPAYGQMFMSNCVESLVALTGRFHAEDIPMSFTQWNFHGIEEARNIILTYWHDQMGAYDYLLMVDSDMGFEPETVIDMIGFSQATKQPVVGALYPMKKPDGEMVGVELPGDPRPIANGFMEMAAVGGGLLLIHRAAVARLLAHREKCWGDGSLFGDTTCLDVQRDLRGHVAYPMFEKMGFTRLLRAFDTFEHLSPEGFVARPSEDISFCMRFRAAGGRVWAKVDHVISHQGMMQFRHLYAPPATAENEIVGFAP